jgi:hypothetical protein
MSLTDTQLLVLSSATQREDGLAALPDHLKGSAAKSVVLKLIAAGLLEEVIVGRGDPHWRKDEEDQPLGLRITRAGLQAIGLEPEDGTGTEDTSADPALLKGENRRSSAPRNGSKRALVIALLSRAEGASPDELVAATGWLPHTTRAALTSLRQNGHEITRVKNENGRSLYRITGQKPDPVTETAPAANQTPEVADATR